MTGKRSPKRPGGRVTTLVEEAPAPTAGPVTRGARRTLTAGLTIVTLACSGDSSMVGRNESVSVPPPPGGLAHAELRPAHDERSRFTLLLKEPGNWNPMQVQVKEITGASVEILAAEHGMVQETREQVAALTLNLPRDVLQVITVTLLPERQYYEVALTPKRLAATFGPIRREIRNRLRDHGGSTPQLRLNRPATVPINSRQWIEGQEQTVALCEYHHQGPPQHIRVEISSSTCAVRGMVVIDGQLFPLSDVEDLQVQEGSCIGVLVCPEDEAQEGDTAEVLVKSVK